MMSKIITIPSTVTKGEELVVIPRSSYEKFRELEGEVNDALAKVSRGRKAHKEGRTYVMGSPKDFFK